MALVGEVAAVSRPRALRVLVVEDDSVLRRSIVRAIHGFQTETLEAGDVRSALRLLQSEPDLVVLDVSLPDGTGQKVAQRASELPSRPLMIAMSGTATAPQAFELASVGVDYYLSKPFRLEQFVAMLTDALNSVRAWGASGASGASGSQHEAERVTLSPRLERCLERYSSVHKLSPREREIVALALCGVARRSFPARLGVTDNTCKTAIRRLLVKCDADRLAEIPRRVLLQSEPPLP